jgi:hypothetical protein
MLLVLLKATSRDLNKLCWLSCLQLYGADERTAGVVPVGFGGRAQAAAGWPPGQVTPSQMILVSLMQLQRWAMPAWILWQHVRS